MSYIELEAAVTAVDESPCWRNSDDWFAHASVIEENLRAIPTADVRPVVRGKWRPYSPLTDTYECDKCGYQVIDEIFRTNFCPNCGADMREPPKEE